MQFTGNYPFTLNFTILDWDDLGFQPVCVNDRPINPQTLVYPLLDGIQYNAGSVFTLVFGALDPEDVQFLTAACQAPLTLTISDQLIGNVRGYGTGVFTGSQMTVTLTQNLQVRYLPSGFTRWTM